MKDTSEKVRSGWQEKEHEGDEGGRRWRAGGANVAESSEWFGFFCVSWQLYWVLPA